MKLKQILLPFICSALVFSCEKPENSAPADISGTWVISAGSNGSSWTDLNIDKVFYFDGSGNYSVAAYRSKVSKVSYYNGQVYAEESDFQRGSDSFTAKVSGGRYTFSSLPGTYTLVSSSSSEMVFDYSGSASYKGYKFSKVSKFAASLNPEQPDRPDEPDEPDTPKVFKINGTEIADGNDLVGLISDKITGAGIPGVVVSDGYDCVATDANGVYQFKSCDLTRVIYYSTPSEYAVATSNPSVPHFYKEIKPDGEVVRTDFSLTPLAGGKESQWTFIGIGDPQCATSSNATRYASETIPDIKLALAGRSSVYAMTLGDIVFDSTNMWPTMRASMSSVSTGSWFIPFFQTIGNHDHDSLKPDTTEDLLDDYNATSTFVSFFGPTDYSFNRGDVHIVSMDDIRVSSQSSSSKSNGKTWKYGSGFTDSQLAWLKKDLELVPDKAEKMIFICCHIPFRGSTTAHMLEVVKLMLEFKEAHLMIGHTHYTQNYVYGSAYKAKGGLPVYEHIHGSACGAWWTSTSSSTVTGEPNGYTVYEIDGAHIKDWRFKGTRRDADFQLRVFDGNEVYYTAKSYPLNWYTASQKAGSGNITVKGNTTLKGCFVAQVFNDDDTYWKVELRKKSTGEKIGDFKRIANKGSANIAATAYYFNLKGKNSDSYCSVTASHYWYYQPASQTPANEKDWEVVAIQQLPGGVVSHSYSCSTLYTEKDLEKEFYF
ncbi:MAG: calcineurin-like phosphoesterase C-terminal domain-containing protein [Bacteroidales bacterium]|nr:calcineurin-like phosphoesterase C-terminal domain-containing protein [Bacteroidales bacterium]